MSELKLADILWFLKTSGVSFFKYRIIYVKTLGSLENTVSENAVLPI